MFTFQFLMLFIFQKSVLTQWLVPCLAWDWRARGSFRTSMPCSIRKQSSGQWDQSKLSISSRKSPYWPKVGQCWAPKREKAGGVSWYWPIDTIVSIDTIYLKSSFYNGTPKKSDKLILRVNWAQWKALAEETWRPGFHPPLGTTERYKTEWIPQRCSLTSTKWDIQTLCTRTQEVQKLKSSNSVYSTVNLLGLRKCPCPETAVLAQLKVDFGKISGD